MENNVTVTSQNTLPQPNLISGKRFDRWIASLVDGLLIGLIALPFFLVAELILLRNISFSDESIEQISENPFVVIIALVIVASYKIGFVYYRQATPGKNWRKLKIVNNKTGEKVSLLQAIVREISQVVYYLPLLGYLLYLVSVFQVLFTKKRRALHDLISGTMVIQQ